MTMHVSHISMNMICLFQIFYIGKKRSKIFHVGNLVTTIMKDT